MNENIAAELSMLRERYPDTPELTFDQYADYFEISRHHASQHFNKRRKEIPHKQIGRKVTILLSDFALYLANQKIVNGRRLTLTADDMKRKRGFCS